MVCQEEKRLFVKKQYERIGLSNGEEFLREKELNRNCLSERKEFFREEEQFKLFNCQEEKSWLRKDNQRRDLFIKKKRLFKKSIIEQKKICQKEKNII